MGVSRYSNDNFPSHGRGGIDAGQSMIVAVVRFGSNAVIGKPNYMDRDSNSAADAMDRSGPQK